MYKEQQRYYQLSVPQKGIWYTEKLFSETSIAGISATVCLKMPIDFSLLEQAINLVIKNNDSMRINVCMVDNEPQQFIAPYVYKEFEIMDFTVAGNGDFFAWESMMTRTPLLAENTDLYLFVLLKIDENTCGYYVKHHHLISDAWSIVSAGNDIMRYYLELKKGHKEHAKRPSFLDHLSEESAYIGSERYKKDAVFWREQFSTLPEQVGIKARKTNEIGSEAARRSYTLPKNICKKIREFSASSGTSTFVIFMSSFILYINRITGCEDTVVGTPVIGRHNNKAKATMGMFVSSIPLRINVDVEDTYSDFTQKLAHHWISVLRHQRYHIDHILQDVRNTFGTVDRIYDIMLSYQNAKFEQPEDSPQLDSYWHFNGHQVESLIININERDNDGSFMIDYDFLTGVFYAEDIDALHNHNVNLLWHVLDDPQKKMKNIEMISDKAKEIILSEFNDTDAVFPDDRTMLSFFEDRAARCPDEVAVLFEGDALTYRELDSRSNALARLLREKGVGRGSIVAMMLHRSFEMMVGILGIWKAGGAYLPIAPDYPEDRIDYMLEDGGVHVLLTAAPVTKKLVFTGEIVQIGGESAKVGGESAKVGGAPAQIGGELAQADGEHAQIGGELAQADGAPAPDDLAYVIYTSGSTGKAKGVMVEHRALVNRINWMNRKYPLTVDDVILQKTTYTFDVSVWELVWWFFAGVKMVFLPPDAEKQPDKLIDAIASYKITTLHFVPSMLNAFLGFIDAHYDPIRLRSLRKVFASGEALTPQQVNRFNASIGSVSGARLYNLYGPTEAAIDVSYYDCPIEPGQRVVPIGKPIDNIQLYIVDRHMNLQPIGVPGELCIGGVGLARGYINKPELTAEKFVPNPFSPGKRLYKTGDLVRWFPKGDIEYLGRMDFQIKIRGFRIELGDIQYHLEMVPSVNEAVIACFEKPNGDKYLAAYYVSNSEIPATTLRDFLSKRLPEYMIPSNFVHVERIPLLANGKANVSLLPKPHETRSAIPTRKIISPRNKTEALVMRVWSETLGTSEISVTDNFFSIGGDSISAIDMVCRMPEPVNVSKLYEYPVLEDFARNYNEKGSGGILTLLAGEEHGGRSYILCPYGGGGAYIYLDLAKSLVELEPECCVYSVNLPGHDYGAKDNTFLSISDAAALVLKETAERVFGRIVIFSHCVGTALGVELARLFELSGTEVEACFIGGIFPPAKAAVYGWFFDPWMFVRDKWLMKFLNTLGLSAENPDQKEPQIPMKAFRYDARTYYRYFAKRAANKQSKLSVPVFSIIGELDRLTKRTGGRHGWPNICDTPVHSTKIKNANHYFVKTHAKELADIIVQSLCHVRDGALDVPSLPNVEKSRKMGCRRCQPLTRTSRN